MAINDFQMLFQGQLPSTVGTLYTAPSGAVTDRAMIKEMTLVNTGVGAESVELFVNGTANANKILSVTLEGGESGQFSGTIILNDGDVLAGVTDTASTVTLSVFGMEMT